MTPSIEEHKPDFEVVCNDTNNSPESIKEGRLNVDLVFHGSLAAYVRTLIEEIDSGYCC